MAKRIPTPGRPVIKKTVVGNSGSRTNTGVIAKAKPKPKPKSNPYMDSIKASQKKQNDALMAMWAKDKKRKNAKIRTK